MQIVLFLCLALLSVHGKKPGYCKNEKSCQAQAKGYTCVSVQTSRTGATDVKQCLPNQDSTEICAGVRPGVCPSLSTWPTAYKSISCVCAFIYPTAKCKKPGTPNKAGYVNCLYVKDLNGEEVGVIYGCVDYSVFDKRLLFKERSSADKLAQMLDYPKVISDNCINPSAPDVVCSARGTCVPSGQRSMDYRCVCTVGYKGRFCQKIDSNKCINAGQCAAGTCNMRSQQCECNEGTTGNQCAYCDPTSSKACGGHGKCMSNVTNQDALGGAEDGSGSSSVSGTVGDADRGLASVGQENVTGGVCNCESGYTGAQCDRRVEKKSVISDDSLSGSDNEDNGAALISLSVVFTYMLLLMPLILM